VDESSYTLSAIDDILARVRALVALIIETAVDTSIQARRCRQ